MTWRKATALALLAAVATMVQTESGAQPKGATTPAPPIAEEGPTWASLQPAQRQALQPLQRDWAGIDAMRKRKWLEISDRFSSMSPQDQARMQTRMTDWARMSPGERNQARLQFQEAKQIPASERTAGWEAYRALPPDERKQLAGKAAAPPAASSPAVPGARPNAAPSFDRRGHESAQRKSNPTPSQANADPKQMTPPVVQAKPGATTTLISKPPPQAQQPAATSRITATPEYVDRKTLLPQAGAQRSAVARPAGASAP